MKRGTLRKRFVQRLSSSYFDSPKLRPQRDDGFPIRDSLGHFHGVE
jgi:hypothetical protein